MLYSNEAYIVHNQLSCINIVRSSVMSHQSSVACHLSSVICHLSSVICHQSPVICHLSSPDILCTAGDYSYNFNDKYITHPYKVTSTQFCTLSNIGHLFVWISACSLHVLCSSCTSSLSVRIQRTLYIIHIHIVACIVTQFQHIHIARNRFL